MSKSNEALIASFEKGYRVSVCGTFLSTPKNILIQKQFVKEGYPIFSIRVNGKKRSVLWHRLQAYQKFKEKLFKSGIVTRHKNHIKTDCSWENILIGTQKENVNDNPEGSLYKISLIGAEKQRKYNATEVKEFYNNCNSYRETMEKFNISSKGTLHFILNKAKHS